MKLVSIRRQKITNVDYIGIFTVNDWFKERLKEDNLVPRNFYVVGIWHELEGDATAMEIIALCKDYDDAYDIFHKRKPEIPFSDPNIKSQGTYTKNIPLISPDN